MKSVVMDLRDGDVLRLRLADGRNVYAEVSQQQPTSSGSSSAPRGSRGSKVPRAAAPAVTPPPANGARGPAPTLVCQGLCYTLTPVSEDSAVSSSSAQLVLTAVRAALPPSDPLLAAPSKPHQQLTRTWLAAAPPITRPPPLAPAPRPPQGEAAAGTVSCSDQGMGQGQGGVAGWGAPPSGCGVLALERVATLEQLRTRAREQPGVWCDGAGPSDPWPPGDDALAVYTAAELLCLLEGRRGVLLLQLHAGWEAHEQLPPYGPYKPLVLRLLREALARSDIACHVSLLPGGTAAAPTVGGLTAVLCADREPFRSWGAHLASFGCQAALEAQSPYYKLLVGRVLGYAPGNVAHHIQSKHGQPPSAEVLAAVEQQLDALSAKRPQLPWTAASRGRKRAKA